MESRTAAEPQAFARRLEDAMQERHLKQVDLIHMAEDAGVKLGKSKLSQYVGGKTYPRPEMLDFLAQALDVPSAWLGGTEASDPAAAQKAPEPSTDQKSTTIPEGRPMREFTKSHKLDNVLYDVRGPVVDEANRMEEAGTHVLKLNIGNPAPFGFRTPDEVVYDMSRQLTECEGYSASRGLFSARKAIMQYDQLKGLPNVEMNDIYTGNGVSELINLTMQALLDDGDEILIPSPDYPL